MTCNSLIRRRIEVKLVSMESERSILYVYNKNVCSTVHIIRFEHGDIR